jgi:hypothetical protein
MVPLAISSEECVEALALAGFRILRRSEDETVLGEGRVYVVVPHAIVLMPSVLDAVLRAARMSPTEFLELLSVPVPDVRPAYRSGSRPRYLQRAG